MGFIDHFDKARLTALGRRVTLAGGVARRQHRKGRVANKILHPFIHIGHHLGRCPTRGFTKLFLKEIYIAHQASFPHTWF